MKLGCRHKELKMNGLGVSLEMRCGRRHEMGKKSGEKYEKVKDK